LLPIAAADLVLGTQWLATLDTHLVDYNKCFITFYLNEALITLEGDSVSQLLQTQFHHFKRLQATDAIAELYTLHLTCLEESPSSRLELLPELQPETSVLLHHCKEVFQQPHGLPPLRTHDHHIPLVPNTPPVRIRPYRYPHSQKIEIERLVTQMLQEGIIQPSSSPFSSPILLVKKKDGTWRFFTDYRALNVVTIKDSFPMPTVDELLDELFGAKFFSKLDLHSGYHQIPVHPADRHKMAFRTHHGLYEWLVMPFGLTNAPATFQSLMNSIFAAFLRKFVLVIFDDILIYSPSWTTHLDNLSQVLQLMKQHSLFAKLSKCSFGQAKFEYLGRVVTEEGVQVDDSKILAIKQWPMPTSVKQLRAFLGLASYYRRFIKGFALLVAPLTDVLKKDAFQWSEQAEVAFLHLKSVLTQAPVLVLPNFSQPFVLDTDTSSVGIEAVLTQNNHPIAFFSKKLSG